MIRRIPAAPVVLAFALGLSAACATTNELVDDGASVEPTMPEGDLGLLVEDLLYGTPEERLRAVDDISGLGADGAPAAGFLIDVLTSDLPSVRAAAARALPQVQTAPDQAVPALTEALADEEDEVVGAVAETLATYGAAAVDPLIGALDSERAPVRSHAAQALGAIGTDAARATPPLVALLRNEDAVVRVVAARTLGQVATGSTKAVQPLVRALDDEDEQVRANAAWAIGEHGSQARWSVLPLIDTLRDGAPVVRMNAATALGKMGRHASQATLDLQSLLDQESNEAVRHEVSEALRLIRGDE
jgi:HEAT repeat protein